MNMRRRSFLALAAVLAGVMISSAQAQDATAAHRAAALKSQQMARQAMIARQNAAQGNYGYSPQAMQQRAPRVQPRASQGGYGTAAVRQPVVSGVSGRSGSSAGVRSTASGASLVGLRTAMSSFAMDMGRMPTAAEGLGALLNRPPGAGNWRGPYISSNNWRQVLTDPWGNLYRYNVTGAGRYQSHTISSNGPDGIAGTSDDLQVQF